MPPTMRVVISRTFMPNADLVIGGNFLAIPVAKPRAYNHIHAPIQRQKKKLRYLLGVMLCAIRGTARAYVLVSECWPSESMITILCALISRAVSKAGAKSCAVACVPLMTDDVGSCGRGQVSSRVGTAVVHDDHAVDVLLAAQDHPGDGALLIVGGHGGNG